MLTSTTPNSRTLTTLYEGLTTNLHIGAQLYATLNGTPVAKIAHGLARLAADSPTHTDVPMTTDTLMLWLSAGKPITAAAILMLMEKNLLTLDTHVASIIPEFGNQGKEEITLRHLLTHTAGIRALDLSYPFATWDETLHKIYTLKLERDWLPGQKAGYHAHSSWYLLGEIINRLTQQPFHQWIRDNLFIPLKMHDTWLSLSPTQYQTYATRIGYLYDTSKSSQSSVLSPHPLGFDTELAATRPRPSASCRGPMHNLARFYEMLRQGGTLDGATLLSPETVQLFTSRQRTYMLDITFKQTIDWGFGLILNSSQYGSAIPYQFGPYASPNTFGHGGSQSSTGFCDPQNHLTVSLLFNGCPGAPPHDKRLRATLQALYQDLGLESL